MKKIITSLLTMLLLLGLGQVGNATTYDLTYDPSPNLKIPDTPRNNTFDFTSIIPANEVIDGATLQVFLIDDGGTFDLLEAVTINCDGTAVATNKYINNGSGATTTLTYNVLTYVAGDKILNLSVAQGFLVFALGDCIYDKSTLTLTTSLLPVPLPPSVLLLGSGLMGLGLLGWRRRRSG
jgi:hypothetical protein